jgi:acid stress-induced BolA-like protein IbaG/YrbA
MCRTVNGKYRAKRRRTVLAQLADVLDGRILAVKITGIYSKRKASTGLSLAAR